MKRTTAARSATGKRRGEGRPRLPWMSARAPPASNRRLRRRRWRTVIPSAAATCAFLSRPLHSPFNSPGRCSSFRLNVKVSIDGGLFHGAVRGGHIHVAAADYCPGVDRPWGEVLPSPAPTHTREVHAVKLPVKM